MIAVLDIELKEDRERDRLWGGPSWPSSMTRATVTREVVIRLRIDDDRDLERIRDAVLDLARPVRDVAAVEPEPIALPEGGR